MTTRKDRVEVEINLNASRSRAIEFGIYIPNKGRASEENKPQVILNDWDNWIVRAMDILGEINGGATAAAASEGFWVDTEKGAEQVWEKTVYVYSYIDPEKFYSRILEISEFIFDFGRQTNQGTVFLQFDGQALEVNPPYQHPS